MNTTVDPETRQIRLQAQAERRVESCERPHKDEVEEQYAILKGKNVREEDEDLVDMQALLMKTA